MADLGMGMTATASNASQQETNDQDPLLVLVPVKTLTFSKGEDDAPYSSTLMVTNASEGHVAFRIAFKLKTKVPKAYTMSPSSGTLAPGDSQEVQITTAEGVEPTTTDRFMVQAVTVE